MVQSGIATIESRPAQCVALWRCPVCLSELTWSDDTLVCQGIACGKVFPSTHGIPILLHEANSVFDRDTFLDREPTFFRPRGWFRNWVTRCLPTEDRNVAAQRVLRRLRDLLLDRCDTPRVLVLGGGVLGNGMEALVEEAAIELVETDVSLESRTQVICDAHDLPFSENTFDAVIVQATLEHVVDPGRCVAEVRRVLKPRGLVYADTPFMQQVHGRQYDFTRYTRLGHRRLFRYFEEIESGISVGPASALAWSLRYFLLSFFQASVARHVVSGLARIAFGWLKYLDYYLASKPSACDAASAFYFLGQKTDTPLCDRQLLEQYRGGF